MKMGKSARDFYSVLYSRRLGIRKKAVLSYVSIFLVLTFIVTATFSWFTLNDTASVDSDAFTMESVAGLRVNDGGDLKNHIKLDNFFLEESSSVDGRNLYFPTTGTFSNSTSNMVFREGNAGDKNVKYVYKDFSLKGDSGITYVYVKNYTIKVADEVYNGTTKINYDENGIPVEQIKNKECPIRIAFITDSSENPTVIDPTAIVNEYVNNFYAINSINVNGKASVAESTAKSFSDFYFATGSPIFTLSGTDPVDVTMVVWFEGTGDGEKFDYEYYAGKSVSIDIELESNWSDMEMITFVDDTLGDDDSVDSGKWIGGGCLVTMSYKDINADEAVKTVVMRKTSDTSWVAPIPKNITTDISFYRLGLAEETIFNSWHTKVGVNGELSDKAKKWTEGNALEVNRKKSDGTCYTVYTAKRGNGYGYVKEDDPDKDKMRLSPCVGYWNYTGGSSEDSTTPTQPSGSGSIDFNVYVENMKGWVIANLNSGNYDLYIEFYDGTRVKLDKQSDVRYVKEGISVEPNTIIQSFVLVNKTDDTEKYLGLDTQYVIISNINMTFGMTNDDKFTRMS